MVRLPLLKSLPCDQPLEAHLSGPIAQDGVEFQIKQVCVLGVARYPCTGCIHDAAYLSVAVTDGCAEVQRRGPIGVIPGS